MAVKKREKICSVDEYQTLVVESIRRPKPVVTRIADKMLDVDNLISLMGLNNRSVDVNGCKVELRDKVRWIRVSSFGSYEYRHSFSEEEVWKKVDLIDETSQNPEAEAPVITMLPVMKHPIKPAKLKDIQKQLIHIPTIYKGFYQGLLSAENNGNAQRSDSSDDELHDVVRWISFVGSVISLELLSSFWKEAWPIFFSKVN